MVLNATHSGCSIAEHTIENGVQSSAQRAVHAVGGPLLQPPPGQHVAWIDSARVDNALPQGRTMMQDPSSSCNTQSVRDVPGNQGCDGDCLCTYVSCRRVVARHSVGAARYPAAGIVTIRCGVVVDSQRVHAARHRRRNTSATTLQWYSIVHVYARVRVSQPWSATAALDRTAGVLRCVQEVNLAEDHLVVVTGVEDRVEIQPNPRNILEWRCEDERQMRDSCLHSPSFSIQDSSFSIQNPS